MIGVYAIQNKMNGMTYVGSTSVSFEDRRYQHFRELKNGKHTNKRLQTDWNSFGEHCFSFVVLEPVVDVDYLLDREQYWIDKYWGERCYNKMRFVGERLTRPSDTLSSWGARVVFRIMREMGYGHIHVKFFIGKTINEIAAYFQPSNEEDRAYLLQAITQAAGLQPAKKGK